MVWSTPFSTIRVVSWVSFRIRLQMARNVLMWKRSTRQLMQVHRVRAKRSKPVTDGTLPPQPRSNPKLCWRTSIFCFAGRPPRPGVSGRLSARSRLCTNSGVPMGRPVCVLRRISAVSSSSSPEAMCNSPSGHGPGSLPEARGPPRHPDAPPYNGLSRWTRSNPPAPRPIRRGWGSARRNAAPPRSDARRAGRSSSGPARRGPMRGCGR